jgi:preprotein translocase subunit SecA
MTATAQSAADEIYEFYGMRVVVIPPHTPSIRVDHPDVVLTHRDAKRRAIVREIINVHALGRPILVGTASIKESEGLAGDLRSAGINCTVLNAKNDELEAGIIAKAGMLGTVTISTNMAGRGVDIKLGGSDESQRDAVLALGGLYVIGTNRHESLRIDRQLRGRAGRQGDPGATCFFISLEDDLFDHYGLTKMLMTRHRLSLQDEALTDSSIRRKIAHAQRIIEGQNFDIRRTLFKFSSLVEIQRQIVQARREEALLGSGEPEVSALDDSAGASSKFSLREPVIYEEGVRRFGIGRMIEIERRATLFHLDRLWSDHLAWIQDTRDSIHLVHLGAREPLEEFLRWATDEFFSMEKGLDEAVISEIASIIQKNGPIDLDLERLRGPSSTWTYLVNDANQFGWGVEMVKARKMAFFGVGDSIALGPALIGPLIHGPLFMLTLLLEHIFRRKRKS